ncbi:MAG: endonuclease/exonuclease/phosphatase family protein [Fidelibacterota bacterium]
MSKGSPSFRRGLTIFWGFLLAGCSDLATDFAPLEDAVLYEATRPVAPPSSVKSLTVMTWNIRYGAGHIPWFGDSCGDRVILTRDEVMQGLEGLAGKIRRVDPDILLLQEVDRESKRTAYVDQVQWLLDHTDLNYGAYASAWRVQFIPSDGLGRMDTGNAILSRWKITGSERISLDLRGDQSDLTRYFYLRRNILKVQLNLSNPENLFVVNVHSAAFAEDDTKQKHIQDFERVLAELDEDGSMFVAGGDLNEVPPGSDSTDYCDEARCPDEPRDFCPEGSNYTGESGWLDGLYHRFNPAVSLDSYQQDNSPHFTYGRYDNGFWDRKLDYLFTNGRWVTDSDSTHQDAFGLSDHAPVSATLRCCHDGQECSSCQPSSVHPDPVGPGPGSGRHPSDMVRGNSPHPS